ncbi:MAG: peptidase M24 [Desulfobacterales bacterium]|nr:MAG: peptidase M24 [Desulfobacterales bacterium]
MDYIARIKKLQQRLKRRELDAMLITQPHNRRYLSGFRAVDHDICESSGVLLIPASGKGLLLTDFRYQLQAEQEVSDLTVKIYTKGLPQLLATLLPQLEVHSLGYESQYMLHSGVQQLTKALQKTSVQLIPLLDIIEKMRCIKDAEEIAAIRKSVQRNEQVFQEVYPTIKPGMSEIQVALLIEQLMREYGAERPSFDTIVASAENGALPHAVPSRTPVAANRSLTIDMGLVLDGYCSDMTRTFVPGKPDATYKKIHRIVRQAQLAGIAAVRAGATGQEVDHAAREIIDAAGYGQYFGHSLGHGVGLAVHEAPRVAPRASKKLREGMIVTVEPGIYIPGWGGIRLENMVAVKKDGCENLNSDTTFLDI